MEQPESGRKHRAYAVRVVCSALVFRCRCLVMIQIAFSIMHQDVLHVSLAQKASPQFENRVQIFTFHLSIMNLQDQVTLTNWPASKKKVRFVCSTMA